MTELTYQGVNAEEAGRQANDRLVEAEVARRLAVSDPTDTNKWGFEKAEKEWLRVQSIVDTLKDLSPQAEETMTEQTNQTNQTNESTTTAQGVAAAAKLVQDLQKKGAPIPERKEAQRVLEDLLDQERGENATVAAAEAQVGIDAQAAEDQVLDDARWKERGEKQARRKAYLDKAMPRKGLYE